MDDKLLARIIHKHNKKLENGRRPYAKKRLLPYYLKVKESDPERWAGWDVDEAREKQLVRVLRVKPRRTASGVATITVITKPWKCSSDCLYCPCDLRMPKSYLSDEPACQRAERNYFDPYLQVASRLRALTHMGHVTDKIELIVLGGTWNDYPEAYRIWFVTELFRALNDDTEREANARERRRLYRDTGIGSREEELAASVAELQAEIDDGRLSYNEAFDRFYGGNDALRAIASKQMADLEELLCEHTSNETARHRVVGLVVETRPDTVNRENLTLLRQLGCTKVQVGIQSVNPELHRMNGRIADSETVIAAFDLLRVFGFKIHAHFMLNLYGATPEADKEDYRCFVTEEPYQPDEVKLYPCSLVRGTRLCELYDAGAWRPYSEEELLEVLAADMLETPPFMRISRMIRDISAGDIVVGNRKANLRQLVEAEIAKAGERPSEIRSREIGTDEIALEDLRLEVLSYETTATCERFLQWVTPEAKIAGFLRLSLPKADYLSEHGEGLPVAPGEAMIREVHVYGKVAEVHGAGDGAQHLGLGRQLVERACTLAKAEGYTKLNVISSVGTREYYRNLGFADNGLYQQKDIMP